MDNGKTFEKLMHLATRRNITVMFLPLEASDSILHHDRLAVRQGLDIKETNYNLALELSHAYLHHDKGDITRSKKRAKYDEQANRAAKMVLDLLEE